MTDEDKHWLVERLDSYEPDWFDLLYVSYRYPIIYGATISSRWGVDTLNSLSRSETDSGWGTYSIVAVTAVLVAALAALFWTSAGATAAEPPAPTQLHQPQNMLVIPGVNAFIPLSATVYVVLALLICVGIHELTHALVGLFYGSPLEEYGIAFLGPLPLGAFVKPDDESHENLPPLQRAVVYASAPLVNLWLAAVFIAAATRLPTTVSTDTIIGGFTAWANVESASQLTALVPVFGNPVTDLCVWGFMLSFNLGLVNLLPMGPLDGGQFTKSVVEKLGTSMSLFKGRERWVVKAISWGTVASIVAVFTLPFVL